MWKIIKNEGKSLIRSKVLLGLSIIFFLILLCSVLLGKLQSDKQMQRSNLAKKQLRNQWENIEGMNAHGAAHYGTYIFKPSNFLNGLDEGVNSVTGNVLRVEGHVQNEIVYAEASQMQAVSKFGKLKSALLLQYVLPLLLIFLAFHSISSEKQSGRLKLLMLQGTEPSALVWGKTVSVWLYGMALLTLTLIFYALFNLNNIDTEIINRTLFFYLSYTLYYFILIGLTVLFAARANANLALTSMLGIWIIWTVFLPNILMSSVTNWHQLPSRNQFKEAMKEERSQGIDGHNPYDERVLELENQVLAEYGVDSLSQLPINFDGLRMQADEEFGNQVWNKHFGGLRSILSQQKTSYQLAGILNPFISLQNASMGFAASDNFHHQEFLVQVEHYRRTLIKALNDEHAFGGSKTGDWDWEPDKDFYKSVPDFKYQNTALDNILKNHLPDIMVLIGWTILIGLLLVFATKKMPIL